ncbi:putative thioredoxin-disulfide reductase [Helianthus annuus]|nr:putative thioredoxin-disulfide reductase [Helianthus annuus]
MIHHHPLYLQKIGFWGILGVFYFVGFKNVVSGEVSDLKMNGLFFAIGHEQATKFLDGQLELDSDGYVVTKPGTTITIVKGVFAAGDVQDKKYRQAIKGLWWCRRLFFIWWWRWRVVVKTGAGEAVGGW